VTLETPSLFVYLRGSAKEGLIVAYEAAFDGNARRFGAAAGAELGEDVNHVALDGSLRDKERSRDFLVALAASQQPQHLKLARAQLRDFHAFGELRPDRRRNVVSAIVNDADAVNEIFEARVLEQIGARAGAEAAVHVFIAFKRREDDDSSGCTAFANCRYRLDAIHLRHA
jgi:hypothetical protein